MEGSGEASGIMVMRSQGPSLTNVRMDLVKNTSDKEQESRVYGATEVGWDDL